MKANNPTPKVTPDLFKSEAYQVLSEHDLLPVDHTPVIDFLSVLRNRRSSQTMGGLSIQQLSNLLSLAIKPYTISITKNNYYTSLRPSPSAGARHPIDILVFRYNSGEKRSVELYNPIRHSLCILDMNEKRVKSFLKHVNKNKEIGPSTLLWFCIQIDKTGSKYLNPESLFWRDCGTLLMCIQLVATALKIKTCPLGTLGLPYFNQLFNCEKVISGGGILIGD